MNALSPAVPAMSAQEDAPSTAEPDVAFLAGAQRRFDAALGRAAPLAADGAHASAMLRTQVGGASHAVETWLTKTVPQQRHGWDSSLRIIDALLAGIEGGSVVFRDRRDARDFHRFLDTDFSLRHSLVEHFVGAGELMELLSAVSEHSLGVSVGNFSDCAPKEVVRIIASEVMMMRLYSFDMRQMKEHHDAGEEYVHLPLTVRLSLCGFCADVSDSEAQWNFLMMDPGAEHVCPEDDALDSFNALVAQQAGAVG